MNKDSLRFFLIAAIGAAVVYFAFIRKPDHSNVPPRRIESAPAAENRLPERTFQVLTPLSGARAGLDVKVTTRSGALRTIRLNGAQFTMPAPVADPGESRPGSDRRFQLASTDREESLPLRMKLNVRRGETAVTPEFMDFEGRQVSEREVELTWRGNDVEVVRSIRGEKPFALRVTTTVTNHGAPVTVEHQLPLYHWVTRDEEAGGFFRQSWQLSEGICRHGNELYREPRDKLLERTPDAVLPGPSRFVAIGNLYFTTALVPRAGGDANCRLSAEDRPNPDNPTGSIYTGSLAWGRSELATGASRTFAATAYFGPKETSTLQAADPALVDTVNLGFFAFIARILMKVLRFFHDIVGNWGVAIILLTVCVRIALLPLLVRSMKSLAAMQKLKPEIDEINKRLGDNQEAKSLAMMELYRKHEVNPLSGCLPQVAQLPIWWALYTTLQTSVELFHAPFMLWWRDLSAPDPFYVLPLVLGALILLQQKLMPPQGMDPVQAKMMTYFMPIFLTVISLFLPAGLALYMMINSVLGILQQWYTKVQMDRHSGSAIVVRPAAGG